MNNDIGNTLLRGTDGKEPMLPRPAVNAILTDAVCVGELERENEALRLQNEALEEHNANQARERDALKFEIRELRERLAGRVYE